MKTLEKKQRSFSIRKAEENDFKAVCALYQAIHRALVEGINHTGWMFGGYPDENTARQGLQEKSLFVLCQNPGGEVMGSCILNSTPLPGYDLVSWQVPDDQDTLIVHTLVVHPDARGKGYAKALLDMAEAEAVEKKKKALRLDVACKNAPARHIYEKQGYVLRAIMQPDWDDMTQEKDFAFYEKVI